MEKKRKKKIGYIIISITLVLLIIITVLDIEYLVEIFIFATIIEASVIGLIIQEVLFMRGSSYKYEDGEKFGVVVNGLLLGIGIIGEIIVLMNIFINVINYLLK